MLREAGALCQVVDPAYPPDSIAGSGMERLIRDGMHAGRTVRRLFTMDRVDQSGWRGVKVLEVKVQKENASG